MTGHYIQENTILNLHVIRDTEYYLGTRENSAIDGAPDSSKKATKNSNL
jgi:hypothetical protein